MPYKNREKQLEAQRANAKKRRIAVRNAVIELLGGKCNRCSIIDARVLQIDHVKAIHREKSGKESGHKVALKILNGIIKLSEVQLLCANCHVIKTLEEDCLDYPSWNKYTRVV